MTPSRKDTLVLAEEYREHWRLHADAIRERLAEFRTVPREEYLWELLYCLLTPQSRALHAGMVVERLRAARFLEHPFDPTPFLRDPANYIRFHNQKAARLLDAAARAEEIAGALAGPEGEAKREWLVENVKGIGWKEASHFLRNIGHLELAIIDRHILKHMLCCGAIDQIPKSIGTRRAYLALETRFRTLASRSGLTLQELDLLFWSYEEGAVRK